MAQRISNEKFRNPRISFTDGLRKAAAGSYVERGEYVPWMYRALVLAVDVDGGQLETPDGTPEPKDIGGGTIVSSELEVTVRDGISTLAKYKMPANKGPRNPPNSIKARILSNNRDQFIDDEDLRVFWPLFPASTDTPSPGELVYVTFEDQEFQHGLWLGRVAHNIKDAGVNQILKSPFLEENSGFFKANLYPDSATPTAYGKVKYKGTNFEVSRGRRLTALFVNIRGK